MKKSRFIGLLLMLLGATLGGLRFSDVVKIVGSVACFGIGFARLMGK